MGVDKRERNMYKREDLTKTAWASYNSIPNEIPSKYHTNADRLCDFMARVEKVWGKKLAFTCAYRGELLNAKMGGVKNSYHTKGVAVDWVVLLSEQDRFMKMLKDNFSDEIDFAQNYIYRISNGNKIPRNFVHVNIAEDGAKPRQIYNTEIVKGRNIVFGTLGASVELLNT